jgi:GDPmannose 4,6-dehydratase
MNVLNVDEIIPNKECVIITGVTGQDGSFMADYLLKNTDYDIYGGARRLSVSNHDNIKHLENNPRFKLINFDLTDSHSIANTIEKLFPRYFINFAAQSFVKSSWDFPAQTWDCNTKSIIHILEAIRTYCPGCRFYNAGSSEEFGDVVYEPQDEKHPLRPRSPYGASKAAVRQLVKVYRESYNLYALQGWLFNHEGTRRGEEFVTRKISKGVSRIKNEIDWRANSGLCGFDTIKPIELGNINVYRDWSDAEDMVDAIWRMLNQEIYRKDLQPELYREPTYAKDCIRHLKEYVVSSDKKHTVREFVEESFKALNIKATWYITDDDPLSERYVLNDFKYGMVTLVKINPVYYRPAEVSSLYGDSSQIRNDLGWKPNISFSELVNKMVKNDFRKLI